MTTVAANSNPPVPAKYTGISSLGDVALAVKRNASALAVLHVVIWGGFTALAAWTSTVMIRWDIVVTMIQLDRLSGTVQTRQEWSELQGQIASYFWSGYMFSGGWLVGTLYFVFLSFVFASCWAAVHMTALRIVAAPRRLSAFEGFVLATPRLAAGVLPYLLWVAIILGLLGYRLAPKLLNTRNDSGSWRILDILGALPIAAGASLLIALAWIFLMHQAALGKRPRTAWLTCIPLVWKSPAVVIGRWLGHIAIVLVGVAAIAYLGYWFLTSFSLAPYTAGLVAGVLVVLVLTSTTWVTLSLLPLWQANSELKSSPREGSTVSPVFAAPVGEGESRFHADSAEWVSQDEGAAIYVPTVDGGVTVLNDASPSADDTERTPLDVEASDAPLDTPPDSELVDTLSESEMATSHAVHNLLAEEVAPAEREEEAPLSVSIPKPVAPSPLDDDEGYENDNENFDDQQMPSNDANPEGTEGTGSETASPKPRRRQPPPLRRSQ